MASYQSSWSYFSNINEVPPYVLSVQSDNEAMGSVDITTIPDCENNVAEIVAVPLEGYHFVRWNDGDTNATRTVTVISDTTFIAYFETDGGTEGIGDVDGMNAKVYSVNGQVVVEKADGLTVALYDAAGRQLAMRRNEGSPVHFDVPASGTYLVKVGSAPARRIVVVK